MKRKEILQHCNSYQAYLNSPYRSVKHSTYFAVYDELFTPFKGKPITFVEIGVLGGGSLFMWRDFFGSNARIIGIDLNPEALRWKDEGFEIFIGNQKDASFWDEFSSMIPSIDILLDDGGHTYEQQIITVERGLDLINDGGLLVVEDTHTSYMGGFGLKKYSFIEYSHLFTDRINFRSHKINKGVKPDFRVWSMRFYESIVAFHIKKAQSVLSEMTDNGGINLEVSNFTYEDNALAKFILRVRLSKIIRTKKLSWLRDVLLNLTLKNKKTTKKYFY